LSLSPKIIVVHHTSAVARRQRAGSISAADATTILNQFRQDVALEYRILEITPPVLSAAAIVAESYALRAHDAVQLAVVSELHTHRINAGLPTAKLVSADQELNTAAKATGLQVEDPNLHP